MTKPVDNEKLVREVSAELARRAVRPATGVSRPSEPAPRSLDTRDPYRAVAMGNAAAAAANAVVG